MESAVRELFARYESFFARALAGTADMAEAETLYTTDVIAASPAGVMSGKTADFRDTMAQGYAHYRAIGTRTMRLRELHLIPIDDSHCVAHVGWTATYARPDPPETAVDFEVHYLVQIRDGVARVFGWIAGDEDAALKQHGIP
jgi:hypothetical protein